MSQQPRLRSVSIEQGQRDGSVINSELAVQEGCGQDTSVTGGWLQEWAANPFCLISKVLFVFAVLLELLQTKISHVHFWHFEQGVTLYPTSVHLPFVFLFLLLLLRSRRYQTQLSEYLSTSSTVIENIYWKCLEEKSFISIC